MAKKKKLTSVTDRILLHLLDFKSFEGEIDGTVGLTQIGISNAVGIARGNVAKAIQPLMNDCQVACHKAHVPGFKLKRTIYYLTPQGHAEARELEEKLGRTVISVVSADGARSETSISDFLAGAKRDVTLVDVVREANVTRAFDHGAFLRRAKLGISQSETVSLPAPARFIGRREEVELAISWMGRPGGVTVVINGMPGIGKTSFALQLLRTHGGAADRFFYSIKPWCSLKSLLGTLSVFLDERGQRGLRAYLEGTRAPDLSEVEYLIMRSLAGLGGAALAYDDYHNATPEVREFVGMLHRAAREAGATLLVIGRTVEPFYFMKEATRDGPVRELTLEGLDEESTRKLAGELGVREPGLGDIFARTGGHPLFVELLAMGGATDAAVGLERFVNDEFVKALDGEELEAMKCISVHRYPVERRALSAHQRALPRLAAEGILRQPGEGVYELHEVIRSAIYKNLSGEELERLHRKAAEHYLESPSLGSLMEAVHHLITAGDVKGAGTIILDRGEKLLQSDMMPELGKAIAALLGKNLDMRGEEKAQLLFMMGSASSYVGEWDDALMHFNRALALTGDGTLLGMRCKMGIGEISLMRNDYNAAQTLFRDVLRWAEGSGDTGLRTEANYYLGSAHERLGDNKAALERFQAALKCAFLTNDLYQLAMAHYGMGRIFHRNDACAESLDSKNRALEIALKINNKHLASKILTSIGNTLDMLNRRDEEMVVHERAIELARESGAIRTLAYALSNASAAHLDNADYSIAEKYLEEAAGIFDRLGEKHMVATTHLNKALISLFNGDVEKARPQFHECEHILIITNNMQKLMQSYFDYGRVLKEKGFLDEAMSYFGKALDIALQLNDEASSRRIRKAMN